MKLYVLRSIHYGVTSFYDEAFVNEDKARMRAMYMNEFEREDYDVLEVQIPFAGKYVCYVRVYKGYQYIWPDFNKPGTITDLIDCSDVYPSIAYAKESDMWSSRECMAKQNPDKYFVSPNTICTLDNDGYRFIGECDGSSFNMDIKRIRVIRS